MACSVASPSTVLPSIGESVWVKSISPACRAFSVEVESGKTRKTMPSR